MIIAFLVRLFCDLYEKKYLNCILAERWHENSIIKILSNLINHASP